MPLVRVLNALRKDPLRATHLCRAAPAGRQLRCQALHSGTVLEPWPCHSRPVEEVGFQTAYRPSADHLAAGPHFLHFKHTHLHTRPQPCQQAGTHPPMQLHLSSSACLGRAGSWWGM